MQSEEGPEMKSFARRLGARKSVSDERIFNRLQDELGLTPEDAELVLYMRRQLQEMQDRLRELESELDHQRHFRNSHLTQFRQVYFEAVWREEDNE